MKKQQRARIRVNYSAHALVKSSTKGTIKGTVQDISIEAQYLQIDPIFDVDESVNVEIILLGVDSQLSIKVPARVVRKDQHGVAMRFSHRLEWWPIFSSFPSHKLDYPSHRESNK